MGGRGVVAGILAGLGLLALTPWYVGQRIAAEIAALSDTLAAHRDVTVFMLQYTPGYFRGELSYDIDWRGGAMTEGEAAGARPANAWRYRGAVEVRQGPWVGGRRGLALARLHRTLQAPAALRPWLAESITADGRLTLRGEWQLDVRIPDMSPMASPGGSTAFVGPALPFSLRVTDLKGTWRTDRALSRGAFAITAQALDLNLSTASLALDVSLEGLGLSSRQRRVLPGVWTRDAEFSLARLNIATRNRRIEWRDQSATSRSQLQNGRMEVSSTGVFGPLYLGRTRFDRVTVRQALRNLDPEALSRMHTVTPGDPPDLALDALSQLLAGGPVLTQRFHISIADSAEDLALELRLASPPAPANTPIAALLESLEGEATLSVSEAMIRQAAHVFVEYQAAGAILSEDPERMANALADVWLREAQLLPAVQVSETGIATAARLGDGVAAVEGMASVPLTALFEPVFDRLRGQVYSVVMPDHTSRPLYGTLTLASGAFPDPYQMDIVAGGDRDVAIALGEPCAGLIDFSRPDLVLNFAAGAGPLYIFARSIGDTTLTVRDPDGYWHCNDDVPGRGLNPGLEISQPPSGDYAIWLGTWERRPTDSLLIFSERGMVETTIEN